MHILYLLFQSVLSIFCKKKEIETEHAACRTLHCFDFAPFHISVILCYTFPRYIENRCW